LRVKRRKIFYDVLKSVKKRIFKYCYMYNYNAMRALQKRPETGPMKDNRVFLKRTFPFLATLSAPEGPRTSEPHRCPEELNRLPSQIPHPPRSFFIRKKISISGLPPSEDLKLWDAPGQTILGYHNAKAIAMISRCKEIPPEKKEEVFKRATQTTAGKPLAEMISDVAAELGIFRDVEIATPKTQAPPPKEAPEESPTVKPANPHSLPPSEEGLGALSILVDEGMNKAIGKDQIIGGLLDGFKWAYGKP
jgi:hypothetical protein